MNWGVLPCHHCHHCATTKNANGGTLKQFASNGLQSRATTTTTKTENLNECEISEGGKTAITRTKHAHARMKEIGAFVVAVVARSSICLESNGLGVPPQRFSCGGMWWQWWHTMPPANKRLAKGDFPVTRKPSPPLTGSDLLFHAGARQVFADGDGYGVIVSCDVCDVPDVFCTYFSSKNILAVQCARCAKHLSDIAVESAPRPSKSI
ncbi:MAG: hypothetical protein ACYC6N_06575 [Pirellulaceae bacterium]